MDKTERARRAFLEQHTNVSMPWWRRLFQKIFHPGQKICDVCGDWVTDCEVPVHYGANNGGAGWVHNIHILTSKKGREQLKWFASASKEDIERRVL